MANTDRNDELYELFSALDGVSASAELKAATISGILAAAEAEGAPQAAKEPRGEAPTAELRASETREHADALAGTPPRAEGREASAQPDIRLVKGDGGSSTGTASRKARWRAMRVAALAACLTLALTGGIAYATPASHVELTQDGSTISLGVNCFGITVSASADDEAGQAVIESVELRNVPRDESVERVAEQLETLHPDKPVEVDGHVHDGAPDGGPDGISTASSASSASTASSASSSGAASSEPDSGEAAAGRGGASRDGGRQGDARDSSDEAPSGASPTPSSPTGPDEADRGEMDTDEPDGGPAGSGAGGAPGGGSAPGAGGSAGQRPA